VIAALVVAAAVAQALAAPHGIPAPPIVPSPPPPPTIPMRPEQVLCLASSLVLGSVVDASVVGAQGSSRDATANLKIKVSKIIGEIDDFLHSHDIVSATATVESLGFTINGRTVTYNCGWMCGRVLTRATNKTITTEDVQSAVVGKKFFFGVRKVRAAFGDTTTRPPSYSATVWPVAARDWVEDTWLYGYCKRVRAL
jgi:hypothetical protein